MRKAALVPHVAAAYRQEYGKHASKGGLGSFAFDEQSEHAMAQAMVFSVVGRKSEVGYKDDPGAYQHYKDDSVKSFKSFASAQSMPEQIVQGVADALLNAFIGQPSAMKRVLEVSHDLDLMRCVGSSEMVPRLQKLEKDIGKEATRKLAVRAASAILATGDCLLFAPTGDQCCRSSYETPFPLCSSHAAQCWELAAALSAGLPPPASPSALSVAGELAFDGERFSFDASFNP